MSEQIEILFSKKKLIGLFIASLAFIAAGFWFIFNPPSSDDPVMGNSKFLFVIGIVSIVFFGWCAVVILKKIPEKTPALIINSEGVTDNSSGVSGGFIPWNDILKVKVVHVATQKFIMFDLNNPYDYIKRQKNFLKKKTMEMNYKNYGSPVSISPNGLKCNFDELYTLLQDKFNEANASQKD